MYKNIIGLFLLRSNTLLLFYLWNEKIELFGDYKQKKYNNNVVPNTNFMNKLRRLDSNERPPGYEPGELPTAPLRDIRTCGFVHPCSLFATAKVSQNGDT